jgi:hypothetical protein
MGDNLMEGELIFLGFLMLIGQIILMQMWQNGWFKKENFKIQKSLVMAENKLKMRKLEREMGLQPSKKIVQEEKTGGTMDMISSLLPLLKDLDPDQLGELVEHFIGDGERAEAGAAGDPISMLMGYAKRNPEMVEGVVGFLKGLGAGNEESQQSQIQV